LEKVIFTGFFLKSEENLKRKEGLIKSAEGLQTLPNISSLPFNFGQMLFKKFILFCAIMEAIIAQKHLKINV